MPDTLAADRQHPMYGTLVLPKHNRQPAGVACYDEGAAVHHALQVMMQELREL